MKDLVATLFLLAHIYTHAADPHMPTTEELELNKHLPTFYRHISTTFDEIETILQKSENGTLLTHQQIRYVESLGKGTTKLIIALRKRIERELNNDTLKK